MSNPVGKFPGAWWKYYEEVEQGGTAEASSSISEADKKVQAAAECLFRQQRVERGVEAERRARAARKCRDVNTEGWLGTERQRLGKLD